MNRSSRFLMRFTRTSILLQTSSSTPTFPLLQSCLTVVDSLLTLCLLPDFTPHIQSLVNNMHGLFPFAPASIVKTNTEVRFPWFDFDRTISRSQGLVPYSGETETLPVSIP